VVERIGRRLEMEGFKILNVDGVKAFDTEGNWVLIRASNTTPLIKINSEAKTEERMKELFDHANKIAVEEVSK
jgi:phosphomannomutase